MLEIKDPIRNGFRNDVSYRSTSSIIQPLRFSPRTAYGISQILVESDWKILNFSRAGTRERERERTKFERFPVI